MRNAAVVNYHINNAEPQAFEFDVDGVVGKLVSPELVPTRVNVLDLRDSSFSVGFDTDGITFENHVTRITDFVSSPGWEDTYSDELRALLGFIRPGSVHAEDWMTIDLIYPDRVGQILGVAANDDHDWFYLSRMTPDEVAIFNIYDNEGRPFLGHSALDMEDSRNARVPRKSIESRTLVRYR